MAGESSDSRASQTLKHAVGMVAAAITTTRMIAIRYTSKLLGGQQESMTESAGKTLADNPIAGG